MDTITYSSAKTFNQCQRKFYWQFVLQLIKKKDAMSEALLNGSLGHYALEVLLKDGLNMSLCFIYDWEIESNPMDQDEFKKVQQQGARTRAAIRLIYEKWVREHEDDFKSENVETVIESQMDLPLGYKFMGKIDNLQNDILVDAKFISDPEKFINQSSIGYQSDFYFLALQDKGIYVSTMKLWLIRTITIKFCNKDKDIKTYEKRCENWLIDNNGLIDHEIPINPVRLHEAKHHLKMTVANIDHAESMDFWPPNELACNNYNRECEFMSLCTTKVLGGDVDYMIETQFETREHIHPELASKEKNTSAVVGVAR